MSTNQAGKSKGKAGDAKTPGFEQSLERLEKIVGEMESGSLPLEQMIARFEEGQKLIKVCTRKLNEVEKKIEVLVKKDDDVETEPLDVAEAPESDDEPGGEAPPTTDELF